MTNNNAKNNNATALARYAKNRIHEQNKNVQQVFVGETGSGKTYSSASFSALVDESFYDDMDKTVFHAKDFLHQIQVMKPGESILFEEAGAAIAARNFQSKVNKMIGIVNQTFRHRNLCCTYTVPSMAFIELQVRVLLHAIIDMKWIDREAQVAYGDCWKVNHNSLYGTTELTRYEFQTFGGGRHVIDRVGFSMPPKKWLVEYEKMKTDFTAELYAKFEKELSDEAAAKQDNKNFKLYHSQAVVLQHMLPELKKRFTWEDIESMAGVTSKTLRKWMTDNQQ